MQERRFAPRQPLRMEVVLHYRGLGVLRGMTRDISLAGMFIELPGGLLPEQALVEILWRRLRRQPPLRLSATVVRAEAAGVAARFQRLERSAAEAVAALLGGRGLGLHRGAN